MLNKSLFVTCVKNVSNISQLSVLWSYKPFTNGDNFLCLNLTIGIVKPEPQDAEPVGWLALFLTNIITFLLGGTPINQQLFAPSS